MFIVITTIVHRYDSNKSFPISWTDIYDVIYPDSGFYYKGTEIPINLSKEQYVNYSNNTEHETVLLSEYNKMTINWNTDLSQDFLIKAINQMFKNVYLPKSKR